MFGASSWDLKLSNLHGFNWLPSMLEVLATIWIGYQICVLMCFCDHDYNICHAMHFFKSNWRNIIFESFCSSKWRKQCGPPNWQVLTKSSSSWEGSWCGIIKARVSGFHKCCLMVFCFTCFGPFMLLCGVAKN